MSEESEAGKPMTPINPSVQPFLKKQEHKCSCFTVPQLPLERLWFVLEHTEGKAGPPPALQVPWAAALPVFPEIHTQQPRRKVADTELAELFLPARV